MSDETTDSPPEVVFDVHGIGALIAGVMTYYIRWADIQTIKVEVVGYGEAGAEAFWSIESAQSAPESPGLFAPVEIVVGGDALTARLRSMSGFDDATFSRARAAEERGEAGTFVCWSRKS